MKNGTRYETRWSAILLAVVATVMLAVLPALGSGSAGDLDTGFGSAGSVSTSAEFGPAIGLAQQSSGKLIQGAVDHTVDADGATTSSFWRIRRLTTAGALDTSFGTSGEVELFGEHGAYALNHLVVDSSDRILGVGRAKFASTTTSGRGKKQTTTTTTALRFVVVRFLVDGALDTTFGDAGIAAIEIPAATNGSAIGAAVHVLSDGRILAAGHAHGVAGASSGGGGKKKGGGSTTKSDAVVLMRLLASGDLDTTFGTDGMTITDATTADDEVWPGMIAVQSGGRIIVGGVSRGVGFDSEGWVLTGYTSGGSPDTSFGRVSVAGATLRGLTLDASDRILGSGNVFDSEGHPDFVLMRHGANGALDTTFGSGGSASIGVLDRSMGGAVLEQSDGKIVSAANLFDVDDVLYCGLVRFTSAGALDSGFGAGGFGDGLQISGVHIGLASGAVIDAQGDLAFAGLSWSATAGRSIEWFVARWHGG